MKGLARRIPVALLIGAVGLVLSACALEPAGRKTPAPATLGQVIKTLDKVADPLIWTSATGSQVVNSARLQGRILTLNVGDVDSTGFVQVDAILAGETNSQFNNFGGVDRFWLGPEAGQYGLYFPPGAELNRDTWVVPAAFNEGGFSVVSKTPNRLVVTRPMRVENYLGHVFTVHVRRELGLIEDTAVPAELGVDVPPRVAYAGAYSKNTLTNDGNRRWHPESGLVGIWILGQFNPSDETVVIAPFRPGDDATLGPKFNDNYFGKVSEDAPERLKVLDNAVLFRADSRRVGKFGLSPKRTTGLAGAMDFGRNLLTIVSFDVSEEAQRYGNSQWDKVQAEPYGGDAFQSYNNGVADTPGELAGDPFFELESASPVLPLGPGESQEHRHATHHFQGDFDALRSVARSVLGVDLVDVRRRILGE